MDLETLFEEQTDGLLIEESHPAFKSSNSTTYSLTSIPLNQIKPLYEGRWSTDWIEWFNNEVGIWSMEFGDENNRWLDLEKTYLKNPHELPINLIKGVDGFYYIDDGHHRFAIAFKNNLNKVWAVVKG